jgi:hypothetical protein
VWVWVQANSKLLWNWPQEAQNQGHGSNHRRSKPNWRELRRIEAAKEMSNITARLCKPTLLQALTRCQWSHASEQKQTSPPCWKDDYGGINQQTHRTLGRWVSFFAEGRLPWHSQISQRAPQRVVSVLPPGFQQQYRLPDSLWSTISDDRRRALVKSNAPRYSDSIQDHYSMLRIIMIPKKCRQPSFLPETQTTYSKKWDRKESWQKSLATQVLTVLIQAHWSMCCKS